MTDPTNFNLRSEAADEVLDRLLYGFAIRQSPTIEEVLLHRDVTVPTSLQLPGWPSLGVVRFTWDGSLPTGPSKMYSEPISIVDNLIVSARLFDETGQALAPPWLQAYTFSPLTLHPRGLLPDSQWFEDSISLIVSSTMETGKIRYTLDGSVPAAASPALIEPLVLNESAVVVARWFDSENLGRGNVATATYRKLTTVRHAAVNKLVTMTGTAKLEDPSTAAKLLLDGRLGRDGDWGSPEVLRLGDSDLEAVIDMGVSTKHQASGVPGHLMLDEILINLE